MKFELGKCYEHATGKRIFIVAEAVTTMYGRTLLAEQCDAPDFIPIGFETTDNWQETPPSEWLRCFE